MIFRPALKNHHYTKLPNHLLRGGNAGASEKREDGLKPECLGVLVYLLSHRDDWRITNKQVATVFNISTGKVTTITNQLEASGYIKRDKSLNNGQIQAWDWIVTDEPYCFPDAPDLKKPDLEKPDLEKPDVEKPDLENSDIRITINKNNHWKEKIYKDCPEQLLKYSDCWKSWWEYKLHGKKKQINPQTLQSQKTKITNQMLAIAKTHKLKPCIDHAICEGWTGLPIKNGQVYEALGEHRKIIEMAI